MGKKNFLILESSFWTTPEQPSGITQITLITLYSGVLPSAHPSHFQQLQGGRNNQNKKPSSSAGKYTSEPLVNAVINIRCQNAEGKDKLDAILAGERLIKHALTAVRFDDAATAVAKLQEALAIMYPFKDVQEYDSSDDE